ncbi:MAG: hypothetical protein ACE5FH_04055 [Candidatus Zixiibacteriota bacterium]
MHNTRYLTTFRGDPHFNMAVDEWLFSKAIELRGSIWLRLYTWEQGCITFGFNQRTETAIDHSLLGNTPLIRRITGGRALYHDSSELTYAVAANVESKNHPLCSAGQSRVSSVLAKSLSAFLSKLEIETEYVRCPDRRHAHRDYFHKAPCFDSTSQYEIKGSSGKIVASARRHLGTAFLQHGSIKLNGVASHPALRLPDNPLHVPEPLGQSEFGRLSDTFRQVFEEALYLDILPIELIDKDLNELNDRATEVRKKAIMKRENIKQMTSLTSP